MLEASKHCQPAHALNRSVRCALLGTRDGCDERTLVAGSAYPENVHGLAQNKACAADLCVPDIALQGSILHGAGAAARSNFHCATVPELVHSQNGRKGTIKI